MELATQTYYNGAWVTMQRFSPAGDVIFGNASSYGLASFRVKGTAYFDTTTTINNLIVGGTNVGTALSNLPSGPFKIAYGHNEILGAWTSLANWHTIPDGSPAHTAYDITFGGDSGTALLSTINVILPTPLEGTTIRIRNYAKRINFRQKGTTSPAYDFIQLYDDSQSKWVNSYSANYGAYQDVTDTTSVVTDFVITCVKQHNMDWLYWSFPKSTVVPVCLSNFPEYSQMTFASEFKKKNKGLAEGSIKTYLANIRRLRKLGGWLAQKEGPDRSSAQTKPEHKKNTGCSSRESGSLLRC